MSMNHTQLKCIGVFSLFAIIGFGPISPGCLIGMYSVIMRPAWLLRVVENLYNHPNASNSLSYESNNARVKTFFFLLTLFIIDIAPVPVTPFIAILIILIRPYWFYNIVKRVYN